MACESAEAQPVPEHLATRRPQVGFNVPPAAYELHR
jgi:hypothetical protein